MRELRGAMLEDLAQASALADIAALPEVARPVCPCVGHGWGRGTGTPRIAADGRRTRRSAWNAVMWSAPTARGVFPLDEEPGLLPGHMTLNLQRQVTLLGS